MALNIGPSASIVANGIAARRFERQAISSLRGRPDFLIGSSEGGFLNSVGVLWVFDVLDDRVAGTRDHRLAPRRRERELTVLFGHYDKALSTPRGR